MPIKKCSFFSYKTPDHKPLVKFFTWHTDNDKCNTWGLEATAIPRRVKVQHIKGIANVLADSVWRLGVVGLCHDIDSKDHQQELSLPFEPLPPVEPVAHTQLEVNEVFIASNIEKLIQTYNAYMTYPLDRLMMMSNYHLKTFCPQSLCHCQN